MVYQKIVGSKITIQRNTKPKKIKFLMWAIAIKNE